MSRHETGRAHALTFPFLAAKLGGGRYPERGGGGYPGNAESGGMGALNGRI